jgi:hypothetical protein
MDPSVHIQHSFRNFGLENAVRKLFLLLALMLISEGVAGAGLVDNGNGTVTDTETGLIWQKETAPGTYTWQQALTYAQGLVLAGYTNWRLPNRNELQTLVDYFRYDPSIDPLLASKTESSVYWSSTTHAYYTDFAWLVHFSNGSIGHGDKSGTYFVRAVRSAQSGPIDVWDGDLNGDGNVDLSDAILCLQMLAKAASQAAFFLTADMNGDEKIGLEEAVYVLQILSDIRTNTTSASDSTSKTTK